MDPASTTGPSARPGGVPSAWKRASIASSSACFGKKTCRKARKLTYGFTRIRQGDVRLSGAAVEAVSAV
jgi:hypothetical protein